MTAAVAPFTRRSETHEAHGPVVESKTSRLHVARLAGDDYPLALPGQVQSIHRPAPEILKLFLSLIELNCGHFF